MNAYAQYDANQEAKRNDFEEEREAEYGYVAEGFDCRKCFHYSGGKRHCLPLDANTCSPLTGERFRIEDAADDIKPRTHIQNLPNN